MPKTQQNPAGTAAFCGRGRIIQYATINNTNNIYEPYGFHITREETIIMYFNGPLFLWQFRRIRLITLIGMIIVLGYTLWESGLLHREVQGWIVLFTLTHCLLIIWQFGRVRSRSFGFLYTQGYSRDAIWGHMMLANAASILIIWLPAALAVWTGLRSYLQDLMGNPYFPIMSPLEQKITLYPLLFYLVFLPAFHYAWIRNLQPTRAPLAGIFLVIAISLTIFGILTVTHFLQYGSSSTLWLIYAGLATVSISLFFGSWRLHRRLEVTS